MSHITKVKSKLKNLVMLKKTLKDLNMDFVEAKEELQLTVKAWNNKKIDKNILMEIKTGSSYNIGVTLNEKDNTYEFVADWWGVETYADVTQEELLNKITQKYAYNNVMDKIREKGYELVTEAVDEKKNIRVVVRKWQ